MVPNKRPFSYKIFVISLDSSSKYQWNSSTEQPFVYLQSPSGGTSLHESLKFVGSATGKELVGHIRVDVNTELSDGDSLEKIFIWANEAVMRTDVGGNSTTCLIDRGDINSRASPDPWKTSTAGTLKHHVTKTTTGQKCSQAPIPSKPLPARFWCFLSFQTSAPHLHFIPSNGEKKMNCV